MHRKYIRATVGESDADIPIGLFFAGQYCRYVDGVLITEALPEQLVFGPLTGGATDNAIARWDTATGRLLQNSVVTIDDAGAMTGVTSIDGIPVLDFVRGPTPAVAVDNHIATWDLTSGRLIQDSGLHIGDVVYNFDAEAVTGHIPEFADSTGRRLTDSGLIADNVVQNTGASTDNAVARFDSTTGKFIQNSVVIISDAGAITGVTTLNGVTPSTWVVGPASSVDKRIPYFSGTTGKLLAQTNFTYEQTVTIAPGDGLVTDRIPVFVGSVSTSGARIQDSGVAFAELVFGTGLKTIHHLPKWSSSSTTSYQLNTTGILYTDLGVGSGSAPPGNVVAFGSGGPSTYRLVDAGYAAASVVRGPSSGISTDNTLAVWDGTGGRLLKNGGAASIAVDPSTGIITTPVGVLVHSGTTHTDNAAVRWDGTGAHTQDSTVIIDDSGNVTGLGTLNTRTIANWVEASSTFSTVDRIMVASSAGTRLIAPTSVLITSVVLGPASAVDNAVARFDATTGKLIQNSAVIIDDAGAITGVTTINAVDVAGHAVRHLPSGADTMFAATFTTGDIVAFNGSATLLKPRQMSADATTLAGTTPRTSFGLTAARTSAYKIFASIPYAVSDTGSNIVITATFGGTATVTVSCGAQGGSITTSGGTGTLITGTSGLPNVPPVPVAGIINIMVHWVATAADTFVLAIGNSGSSHVIYNGPIFYAEG